MMQVHVSGSVVGAARGGHGASRRRVLSCVGSRLLFARRAAEHGAARACYIYGYVPHSCAARLKGRERK
ncbi:hypothetical protein A2U01_0064654 [Trifolium medium]|uniref:Uncharacterized protein n=1 Tax=Trifolium medium TaxID=97028 RepID=A0A392S4U9_9FABA|nr:hypothetical protein [Trifolium medium]